MRSGETIRLEASSRTHAESLQHAFDGYTSELVQQDGSWQLELDFGPETAALLALFETAHSWLADEQLASMTVHFDSRAFTLLRPTNGGPADSIGFLLERVAQLQAALESRIVIEQAKGILAERQHITIQQAFELLRAGARRHSLSVHQLAAEVITQPETPTPLTT